MASRAEEKAKRRAERQALEEAERRSASRQRRLQMALGGLLAIAAVVGVVIAVTSSGGGGSGPKPHTQITSSVKLPPVQEADLTKAAQAAGCVVKKFPFEGNNHVTSQVTYHTNPPTSGNHHPEPSPDGVYDPGNTPAKEHFVHALEHGRIEIQYKPGTPKNVRDTLEAIFNESVKGVPGYKTLLFENNTNMPYQVAATAWQNLLGCNTWNPKVVDAIRAFRLKFVDKGPEFLP